MPNHDPSSQELDALARNNAQLILQGIADKGCEPIADALGCDKSTVSRLKEEQLFRICKLMALLNLRVVDADVRVYDELEQNMIDAALRLIGRKFTRAETTNDFFH